MVIAIHSGTVPTCPASHPIVPDFSCGFQPHLSSGTRSSILLVFFISSSNSDSIDCPIVMFASQTSSPLSAEILGEQKAKCQALFSPRPSTLGLSGYPSNSSNYLPRPQLGLPPPFDG